MGLFRLLGKSLTAIFGKPATYATGEAFEHYCRKYIFTDSHFELMQKTHRFRRSRENYIPSADPDFRFRDRRNGKIFYVESKYRRSFFKGQVNWCTDKQLGAYRHCNRDYPVFILLGIGGHPANPSRLSLIPLTQAPYNTLYASQVEKFIIPVKRRLYSRLLWRR